MTTNPPRNCELPKAPKRLGVIGCGAVVQAFHLPALAEIPGVEVAALVDTNLDRARSLAKDFSVPHKAQTCSEIAEQIDAAIIAVPAYLSTPIALEVLRLGKPLFLEKPMCITSSEAKAITEAASASGVEVSVGFVRRYASSIAFARQILDSKALGELRSISIEDGYVFQWQAAAAEFRFDKQRGGGILFDIGSHVIDLLHFWFGELKIERYEDDACGGVPTNARVTGVTKEQVRFEVELSWTRTLRNSFVFHGERGRLEGGWYSQELDLELGPEPIKISGTSSSEQCPVSDATFQQMFVAQFSAWARSLHGVHDGVLGGLADGVANVSLLEHCANSRTAYQMPGHYTR